MIGGGHRAEDNHQPAHQGGESGCLWRGGFCIRLESHVLVECPVAGGGGVSQPTGIPSAAVILSGRGNSVREQSRGYGSECFPQKPRYVLIHFSGKSLSDTLSAVRHHLLRSSRSFTNMVLASGRSGMSGNFSRSLAMTTGLVRRKKVLNCFSSPSVVTTDVAGS